MGACFQNGFSKLYIEEQFGLRCHTLQVLDLGPVPKVSLLSGRYEYAECPSSQEALGESCKFFLLKIDTSRALGKNSPKT